MACCYSQNVVIQKTQECKIEKSKCVTLTDDALIAWAEMLEDMTKMVFVAIAPTLIVLDTKLKDSIISSLALVGFATLLLFLGLVLRNIKQNRKEK